MKSLDKNEKKRPIPAEQSKTGWGETGSKLKCIGKRYFLVHREVPETANQQLPTVSGALYGTFFEIDISSGGFQANGFLGGLLSAPKAGPLGDGGPCGAGSGE